MAFNSSILLPSRSFIHPSIHSLIWKHSPSIQYVMVINYPFSSIQLTFHPYISISYSLTGHKAYPESHSLRWYLCLVLVVVFVWVQTSLQGYPFDCLCCVHSTAPWLSVITEFRICQRRQTKAFSL